ncbi:MAG: hypothetical protein OXB84_07865, partial [Halobacteriovoraceae bacterium]|nr:hypothetical protein [Halobacteriovoraceae bacterium]
VKEIVFDRPKIYYEVKENISNLEMIDQSIMNRQIVLDRNLASLPENPNTVGVLKMTIDNFHIKNASVILINHSPKKNSRTLPAIHLQNIGKSGDGATLMEATWPVISSITEGIINMLGGTEKPLWKDEKAVEEVEKDEAVFSSRDNPEQENKQSL